MAQVIKNSQIEEVPDNEVDLELQSPSRLVGTHANVVPMFNNAQSARLFYAARFVNQAMPLKNREAPLVQSLDPESQDGKSFEEAFGRKVGAKYYDDDIGGTVTGVDNDTITIKQDDGKKKTVNLYNNFQFNRKTQISNRPVVKIGDKVGKGQILAGSNYTDDNGTMSMGINARIAMVPYKGFSMDDAIVVSEDFAKRMTSEHSYEHDMAKDSDVKFGKTHFSSLFPTAYTKEQLANMDDDGVVKPGTILHYGDPIILATKPKAMSSNTHLGKLGKIFRQMRTDASEVWEHEYPGKVVDSVNGKKSVKAFINAEAPLQVGDKIVIRNGQKCYHPDTEILTERGWVRVGDITLEDKVAALFDTNAGRQASEFGVSRTERVPQDLYAKFVHPVDTTSHRFDGELFCFENASAAYAVTGNHRVWCKCAGGCRYKATEAERMHGHIRNFMDTCRFDLAERSAPEFITMDEAAYDKKGRPSAAATNTPMFRTAAFVKFMAFYLCEGNIRTGSNYSIVITQKERPFCRKLEALLDELGLAWKRYNNQYRIGPDKSLAVYLRQFGHAADKFIPEWVFGLPADMLKEFVSWAWQGDGDKDRGSKFYSSSFRMIEGMQRILVMLGYRTRWSVRKRRRHQNHDSYTLTKFKSASSIYSGHREPGYYKMEYHGDVHCVQVPGEGVVLTRYHGKIMWNGNSIVSNILPTEQMVRSLDGTPFEVLLNPLALPSRVNTATPFELALGKLAVASGKPVKEPAFNKFGTSRLDYVREQLAKHGMSDTEEVFDPTANRKLEKPVTTGVGYIYKLHHVVASKKSARGNAAYSQDEQPLKGGSDAAQAKRLGGLETTALMARGAYATLREGSTLRGQKNDDYWRMVRQGYHPQEPGVPFVFEKFKALLNGAGLNARDLGKGTLRLAPFTQRDLDDKNPIEIKNGKMVNLSNLDPEPGGLFDSAIVAGNRWGKIPLGTSLPNPAFEKQIQQLLGITGADMRKVIAGEMSLKEARAAKAH